MYKTFVWNYAFDLEEVSFVGEKHINPRILIILGLTLYSRIENTDQLSYSINIFDSFCINSINENIRVYSFDNKK